MHIDQVGPVQPLPPVTPPRTTLALEWHSGWTTPVLALAELLILVLLLLRWVVRRQGGWRIAWRRLGRQVRLTAGAFCDPVREFLRFRATIRQLTRLLATTGPAEVARAALDDVDTEVTPGAPDAFGLAVAVKPPSRRSDGDVMVQLAGRRVPEALYPWESRGDDLRWYSTAAEVIERAEQTLREARREILGDRHAQEAAQDPDALDPDGGAPDAPALPAPPRLLVPIGLDGEAAVFVDLLRGPGILSTYGDRRATRSFVQAAAAYLDLPDGGAEVVVAEGVHPRFDGPHLDEVLDLLEGSVPDPVRPVVVVCAAPDTDQSLRLSRMAAKGLLRALVVGTVNCHRVEVRVNSRGRTEIPGWGITTDAAPLGPAVARTARKGGAQRTKRAGGGIPPKPSGPSGPRPPRSRSEAPTIPLPPLPARAGSAEPEATDPAPPLAATSGAATPRGGTPRGGTSGAGTPRAGTSGAGTPRAGTSRAATSGAGTSRAATSSAATSGAGTSGAGTSGAATSRAGTSSAATPRAGTSRGGTSGAGTPRAGTSSAATPRAGTSRGGTSGADTSRAGTSSAGTSRAGSSRAGAFRAGVSEPAPAGTGPAGLREQAAEPPAPAIRALFAEPEATGEPEHGGSPDARSYDPSGSARSARSALSPSGSRTAETSLSSSPSSPSPSAPDERQDGQ